MPAQAGIHPKYRPRLDTGFRRYGGLWPPPGFRPAPEWRSGKIEF